MPFVYKHKMYRKVYKGGSIQPLLQVLTSAGTALMSNTGKKHIKKLLGGLLSSVASGLLFKALEKGKNYVSNTLSNKFNENMVHQMNTMTSRLSPFVAELTGSSGRDPSEVGTLTGIKAIDRELVPIKNQLMANTASINASKPEIVKSIEKYVAPGLGVAGNGIRKTKGKGMLIKDSARQSMPSHITRALNQRSDMLLRNL